MFNKAKTFFKNAVSKVKDSFNAVETAVAVRAHAALDGTKAEAYVDTGVKILMPEVWIRQELIRKNIILL